MNREATRRGDPLLGGFCVGDLILDTGQHRLTRDDAEIPLPGLSFDLLLALVESTPNLVTVDQLMDRVWAGIVVNQETVSHRVKLVRNALGDDPHHPRYIAVVRGQGYRIIAPVTPLPVPALELRDSGATSGPIRVTRDRARLRWPAALTIGAAGLMCTWMVFLMLSDQPKMRENLATVPHAPVAQSTQTIAVLPFLNLTGDRDSDYFSDGLTEELLNRLTLIPELHVAARTSSFHFKNRSEDVRKIGEMLGVQHVLEGSVRKQGSRIRVAAQLVRTGDGFHVWSRTYDRDLTGILATQDEIALAVVEALESTLLERARSIRPAAGPINAQAFDAYLRARHLYQSFLPERMDRALEYYREAIRLEPDFAPAYVGLADALIWKRQISEMDPADPALAEIPHLLQKALEVDPGLGDAYALLGHEQQIEFDFDGAAVSLRRAESVDPHGEYVLRYLAQYYMYVGWPPEKGIEYARTALRRDPLNPVAHDHLATAYWQAHQYENALRESRRSVELDPNFWMAHWNQHIILHDLGRYDEALLAAQRAVELNPFVDTLNDLAIAYASVGRMDEARAVLARIDDPARGGDSPPTLRALALVVMGEPDEALMMLERAYEQRDWWLPQALHYKILLPLHDEPRFQRLVRLLGQERRVEQVARLNGVNRAD